MRPAASNRVNCEKHLAASHPVFLHGGRYSVSLRNRSNASQVLMRALRARSALCGSDGKPEMTMNESSATKDGKSSL